jgi:SAM-dependent methyltransferase
MMQTLEEIVGHRFGGLSKVGSFLDFAGGYGRMTRFLAAKVDPARIWTSDIKARAVEFQRRQFGVNGFVSTAEPEALKIAERFDIIFVASLFSHLPESTFARWLRKLCELCRPDGLVIFSVHDVSLLSPVQRPAADFIYSAVNEETPLHVGDRPLDTSQYGLTYVSEHYLRKVIGELPLRSRRYIRWDRALLNHQDIYILSGSGEGDS